MNCWVPDFARDKTVFTIAGCKKKKSWKINSTLSLPHKDSPCYQINPMKGNTRKAK